MMLHKDESLPGGVWGSAPMATARGMMVKIRHLGSGRGGIAFFKETYSSISPKKKAMPTKAEPKGLFLPSEHAHM